MRKVIEWYKARSRQEKVMLGLIILALIAICFRWPVIRERGGSAVRERIERIQGQQP